MRQPVRSLPGNLALVNAGSRRNPGFHKPANIVHNPNHKAAKAGWQHGHRPFYFKHGGHRWRRVYYSFLAGGLWYWYWYDVDAGLDTAPFVYSNAVLPDCDPDSDECIEPNGLIAPALLEGRATEAAMQQCAAEFQSFDANTGTYVASTGEQRVCPYLE